MKEFDDIKALWGSAAPIIDEPEKIMKLVKTSQRKRMIRTICAMLALAGTLVFIAWIGLHYDFELVTTRIGIIITLFAIILGIAGNAGLVALMKNQNDPTVSSAEYLANLIRLQDRQKMMHSRGLSIYFLLLTAGLVLYMYEFAVRDLTFGIIVYSLTLAWIGFNLFYIRKRMIAKQQKELDAQISKLQSLEDKLRAE